jgi:hypothetical protein
MKGSPRSLFLSSANRAMGWWMGHAANAVRQAQSAWMTAAAKAGKPAPKRKRPSSRKRSR